MPPTRDATFITFPPSLDCELGRFLLGHYRVAYLEEPHALLFSSLASLRAAWTPVFPVLRGPSVRLTTVRAIVNHYDPLCDRDRQLVPRDGGRARSTADWAAFRLSLATQVAVFAYHQLLPERSLMAGPLSFGAPALEVRAVNRSYPLFSGLLSALLRITAARAGAALDATRRAMDAVDARLLDGRPYLLGDRLTLSDVTFAVAMAPLVLPATYSAFLPPLAAMPSEMKMVVAEMREHPGGRFALRVYREGRAGDGA